MMRDILTAALTSLLFLAVPKARSRASPLTNLNASALYWTTGRHDFVSLKK